MERDNLWLHGPTWLLQSETEWPVWDAAATQVVKKDAEFSENDDSICMLLIHQENISKVITIENYCNLHRFFFLECNDRNRL